ncbi:uncharacterized protein METZ01_LOCUS124738 [marine metagenome]|uniref:Uncharacterized protein n=1 Tax=marine metagenome TaxID=408172 RepID=A0A381Y4D0_9ZZZZ
MIVSGAISAPSGHTFPQRLRLIHDELIRLLATCQPDCVAIEDLFHAKNARSALKLGHVRGVAILAAVEADLPVLEYTPTQIKRAIVGYGRAEKQQVQEMMKILLGLDAIPTPHDAADALAVALCHGHSMGPMSSEGVSSSIGKSSLTSWRRYRPEVEGRKRDR